MAGTVSISLPLPRSKGSNGRDHWAARAKLVKADRALAFTAGSTVAPPMPFKDVSLTIAYRTKGAQAPDCDNAISRCKAYIDGLTDAGWWVDDPWHWAGRRCDDHGPVREPARVTGRASGVRDIRRPEGTGRGHRLAGCCDWQYAGGDASVGTVGLRDGARGTGRGNRRGQGQALHDARVPDLHGERGEGAWSARCCHRAWHCRGAAGPLV